MIAARWLALGCSFALGCTPFEGLARDAGPDVAPPHDGTAHDVTPDERAVSVDDAAATCGLRSVACDPVADRGCDAGARCEISALSPLSARCAPEGGRGMGALCSGEGDCAAGLHCVAERCLALCCGFGGDSMCASAVAAASHCAIATGDSSLSACTLPGECDYRAADFRGACAAGSGCFPTSSVGEARCVRFGSARFGEACSAPNDCVAGFGCVTFGPPPGVCRRLCRLGLGTECSAGTYCQTFTGRPYDWGFCV